MYVSSQKEVEEIRYKRIHREGGERRELSCGESKNGNEEENR